MRPHCSYRHRSRSGFTLIELSIVVVIISLMVGGLMSALAQETRRQKKAELKMKMDAIEQSLITYVKNPNYGYALPCPANPAVAPSDTVYLSMDAIDGAGNCLASSGYTDGSASWGSVPVRSLGLPDEYAYDPWGNRFTYVVGLVASYYGAFSATGPLGATDYIRVYDAAGNAISYEVSALLISHGPNGFGAFTRNGIKKTGHSINTQEIYNCMCIDDNGTDGPWSAAASYFYQYENMQSSSDSEDNFDDIVRFYLREKFLISAHMTTETAH